MPLYSNDIMPAGSFGSVLDVKVFNVSILVTTIAMLYWHVSPHFDISFNKKLGKYFTCTPYTNENHLNTIVQVVFWQGRHDLNVQHLVLETSALPIELRPYRIDNILWRRLLCQLSYSPIVAKPVLASAHTGGGEGEIRTLGGVSTSAV